MAGPKEYSLKYCFDIQDISKLKPGETISSSCPPTDTLHKGRSVIFSPGGFPLHFSLHLVYLSKGYDKSHRFLLQLRLEEPTSGDMPPFLPPLLIQPTALPCPVDLPDFTSMEVDRRLVGVQQPGVWGLWWESLPWPCPAWKAPGPDSPWTGEFRFQLLDEPLELIAKLPPLSKAQWSCLPKEMVTAVLRQLPLADLVSARLVCHTWASLLDNDPKAWNNVTHLRSIAPGMLREQFYDYHGGRLNEVPDHKLYKALTFLTSRKAPIRSLELPYHEPQHIYQGLKHLPTELSQRHIKLKALRFQGKEEWWADDEDERGKEALVRLMRRQPSLERVYVEQASVPMRTLLEGLPRLRILSLDILDQEYLEAFQAGPPPPLSGLDALRLVFPFFTPDEADIATISSILESPSNGGLRRVQGHREPSTRYHSPCGCSPSQAHQFVWVKPTTSPVTAAFLLMPSHGLFHHHI